MLKHNRSNTYWSFSEIEKLYEFLKKHTKCREELNSKIKVGPQLNRCYTLKYTPGDICGNYRVFCIECGESDHIYDLMIL